MSRFNERLWRELVREHGADLARVSRPAGHGRLSRPLLAGTTVGLAGVGATIALILGAASSSPAFAVTQGHDGTVSIVIKRFGAIHVVNQRLAQLGFRARFVEVARGCAAPPPSALATAVAKRQVRLGAVTVTRGYVHARFDPRKIPAGQMLVVGAWRQGQVIRASSGHVVSGAAPACLPVPWPPPGVVAQVRAGRQGNVQCTLTVGRASARRATSGWPPAVHGAPPALAPAHVHAVANWIGCPARGRVTPTKEPAFMKRAESHRR